MHGWAIWDLGLMISKASTRISSYEFDKQFSSHEIKLLNSIFNVKE